jgi:hypothetical protein
VVCRFLPSPLGISLPASSDPAAVTAALDAGRGMNRTTVRPRGITGSQSRSNTAGEADIQGWRERGRPDGCCPANIVAEGLKDMTMDRSRDGIDVRSNRYAHAVGREAA